MASSKLKAIIREIKSPSEFCPALLQPSCLRCGGFMVNEVPMDSRNNTSELECGTRRCVQCGDILDPVILRNRRIRQDPMTVQRDHNSLLSNWAIGQDVDRQYVMRSL